MNCFKCNKKIDEGIKTKIHYREQCPHCGIDLHCCKNCKFYVVGKPNDCTLSLIDPIRDKETMNFCEEFSYFSPNVNSDNLSVRLQLNVQGQIDGAGSPKSDISRDNMQNAKFDLESSPKIKTFLGEIEPKPSFDSLFKEK